jgi:hypothetical protein
MKEVVGEKTVGQKITSAISEEVDILETREG